MASTYYDLFGNFHICAVMVLVTAAVIAARLAASFVSGKCSARIDDKARGRLVIVLLLSGLVLAALELLKQLYLYFDSGTGNYDWWYFPFQLCSVPMYLCSLLPVTRGKIRSAFFTFMGGYTFVSAVAALIYPEDILSAAPVMTAHGFIWHAILLFISLFIFMTGAADSSAAGLARAALLFAVLSIIAVMINVAAEPVMQSGNAAHSYAAMFYLNPYHISPQPIVSSIQKTVGIPAGLLLYFLVIAFTGTLTNIVAHHFICNKSHVTEA